MFKKIGDTVKRGITFVTHDIWYIKDDGQKPKRSFLYKLLKAFILTIRNLNGQQINTRASALTYSALLAVVPLLAVLFAISRGFRFQGIVESELFKYFHVQPEFLDTIMSLIDRSLKYAESNVFLGIGLIFLLYMIINLLFKVEASFNSIWGVKKARSLHRKFTDYLALLLIAPLFIVINAGLSVLLNSTMDIQILGVVVSPLMKLVPYLITILLFTFVYMYLPNTKVKFMAALIAGVFAGVGFQLFQMLYISGQILITRYNAIYGSFAALPLLLLWLQLTWFICLFGVQLSFSYQNVNKFSFEHETQNISRRYKDFVYLLIMTLIVKRFDKGQEPYTSDQISENFKIPTGLTNDILYRLQEVGLVVETPADSLIPAFMPAMNIDKLSTSYFFDKLDQFGSEDFYIDTEDEFSNEWQTILTLRDIPRHQQNHILLKDL